MAVDLVNVFKCFNPLSFQAWLDSCKDKRKETIETLKSLKDLLKKETLEQIFKDFKEYVSETAGFDNQARYNQGRLIFEVASSFVGVSEIKNALKGGNLALVVSKTLKKAPKESLKIITSSPKIASKTAKEIVQEVRKISNRIKIISFKVDESLKSADEMAGILVNNSYKLNPTAKNVNELIKNPSGIMKLNQSSESILNGK